MAAPEYTAVASNSNLNSLVGGGVFYRSTGSLTAVNAPVGATKWFLTDITWGDGPDVPQRGMQKFETETGLWVRSYSYGGSVSLGSWAKAASYNTGVVESVNSLTGAVTVTLNVAGT